MEGRHSYIEAIERLRASVRRPASEARRSMIDRAVGLLAGRLECRLEEAHGQLLRLAEEQGRTVEDVAAAVIDLLEVDAPLPGDVRDIGVAPSAYQSPTPAVPGVAAGCPVPSTSPCPSQIDDAECTSVQQSSADGIARHLRARLTDPTGAPDVVLAGVAPGGSLRLVGRSGAPAAELPQWLWLPAGLAEEAAAAVRTGQPSWLSDGLATAGEPVASAPLGGRWPSRAWLPIRHRGDVVGLMGLLWQQPYRLDAAAQRSVARVAVDGRRQLRRLLTQDVPGARGERWAGTLQEVLDALPGAVAVLTAIRNPRGEIADYVIDAASPEATDIAGRAGVQMVGLRITDAYPGIDQADLWTAYQRVLTTGVVEQVGPFTYTGTENDVAVQGRYSVRVRRLGTRLAISWIRHDEDDENLSARIRQTERLGNLGWGEWDVLTGHVVWSDQLYRIFERDPREGPLTNEESEALALPEDAPERAAAAEAFIRGESIDSTSRMRINGKIKYIRTVADAVRDASGQPLKIYGIVQDVTARETLRARLDRVEQQLAEQQRVLQAEHQIASQLQHIILPIPEGPIDLPELRVDVRYLPAEHLSHVGGDWYHAVALPDGSTLLAVGDVAGHGMLAATTMAQVRHAFRALAVTTTDPGELMRGLNQLMVETATENPAATATAVIARYDPAKATLTWAQAAHPAMLLSRHGVTSLLPRPRGLLLGVTAEAHYETASMDFSPHDVLIMYTDGLVEHRNRSLDDGLAAVIRTVDEAIVNNPDQPLAALLARLRRANPDDDTCVLAARRLVTPAPAPLIASEDHHG